MAHTLQVAPPTPQPRLGGIKAVAGEIITEQRLGATDSIVWEGTPWATLRDTRRACFDEEPDEPVAKTFDGVQQFAGVGTPFAKYAGVSCWLGGDDDRTYEAQARAALEALEDRAAEAALWEWALAASTAGSPATLAEAIAIAEDYADGVYPFRPALVLSRHDATLAAAAGVLKEADGKLITHQGTPVIASGAIPDDDHGTVAIVGQPKIYATEIVAVRAPNLAKNTDHAIAERVYAIAVDSEFRFVTAIGGYTPPAPPEEPTP